VIRGTGWDEIAFGAVLFFGGCLYLYFREAADRKVAREYRRWFDAFPRLMKVRGIRMWAHDATRRWVVIATGVALILVGGGLIVWGVVWGDQLTPKTWFVQPGETLTVSADQAHPEDRWECPGKGGVIGTPDPGHGVGGSGGFSVVTAPDGTVTAYCEPGPPANV
jgi:hypothetical protein